MDGYLERKLTKRFGPQPWWALVTGASRHPGVGSGVAGELLDAGFNVIAHCGRRDRNPWLEVRAAESGHTLIQVRKDFSDATAMPEFAGEIEEALEAKGVDLQGFAFDVVVHVAGVTAWDRRAMEANFQDIEALMHINAWSALVLTQVLWHKERITHPGGLLVFIGSNNWYNVYSGVMGYAVTKAAVERIAAHFAVDLAPYGVQVVHTVLGWVDCERHHIAKEKGQYDYEAATAVLPTGKPVAAWECGGEVLGLLLTPSKIGNGSRLDAGEHLLGH